MSENLQTKTSRHLGKLARTSSERDASTAKKRRSYHWRMLLVLPAWVFVTFMASQIVVIAIINLLAWVGLPLDNFLRPAAQQTVAALMVYTIAVGLAIGIPYLVRGQKVSRKLLGIDRLPSWTDIGLAPVGYITYLISTTVVMGVVVALISGFPATQTQDIGFQTLGSQLDNLLAFLTLVVLAPIAEELLFRGYLYGKLKSHTPTIIAAIAASLLFAFVHLQWDVQNGMLVFTQFNVAVDVFVLSLVLCALRSLTGSIWAGVLLHMIKNGIAYYILFISPLVGG